MSYYEKEFSEGRTITNFGNDLEKYNISVYNQDAIGFLSQSDSSYYDTVITDIPYDEVTREDAGLRNLNKGNADDFEGLDLENIVEELVRVSKGSVFIFCGFNQVSQIRVLMDNLGLSTRVLVWKKSNPSPLNSDKMFLSDIELCVFGKKSSSTFNSKYMSSVFEFPAGSSNRHPTEKPVDLFEKLIDLTTEEGDKVLDPFAGSGTSGIASANAQVNCDMVELEEEYCEIIENRLKEKQKSIFNL